MKTRDLYMQYLSKHAECEKQLQFIFGLAIAKENTLTREVAALKNKIEEDAINTRNKMIIYRVAISDLKKMLKAENKKYKILERYIQNARKY